MAMLPKLSILEMGGRAWPPGTVPTMGPNEQKSTLGQNKAARFERIGIATLNAAGITRSAHATVQAPSSNLHAKSGLNRTSSTPVCGCSPASSTAKPTGQEQHWSKSTRGSRTRSSAASAKRRTPSSSSPREPGPAPQPEASTTATRMRQRTWEMRSSNCSDGSTRHERRNPSTGRSSQRVDGRCTPLAAMAAESARTSNGLRE